MRDRRVALRYAEALLRTAKPAGTLAACAESYAGVLEVMAGHRDLVIFLDSPQVREQEKKAVLGKVFGPIKAKAVELGRTARVVGDIRYETLTVESEAQVDGHIQRQDDGLQVDRDSPLALVVDIVNNKK